MDVENVEKMNTQTLCSYSYAAYKQEYEDDWKERLELYNDLELTISTKYSRLSIVLGDQIPLPKYVIHI